LLEAATANKDDLMSNDKFAELLKQLGLIPRVRQAQRQGVRRGRLPRPMRASRNWLRIPIPACRRWLRLGLETKPRLRKHARNALLTLLNVGVCPSR
jgi:hypothetical protein